MNSNNSIARSPACVRGLLLVIGLLLSTLPALAQTQSHSGALQIGIVPMSTTRILIKNYQPLHVYLERVLKRPVELVTAQDFEPFISTRSKGNTMWSSRLRIWGASRRLKQVMCRWQV